MSRYGVVLVAVVLGAWYALSGGGAAAGATTGEAMVPLEVSAAGAGPVAPAAGVALEAYPGPATATPAPPTATPNAGDYPAPNPTRQPTRTPWPSPTPTPDHLTVSEVRPAEMANDAPTRLHVYGHAFPEGARVWLGVDGQQALALETTPVADGHLAALVPMGITPGVYDVIVEGEAGESHALRDALRLFDAADMDDLHSAPFRLWSDPASPTQGESVSLGIVVNRAGGATGTGPFAVRFAVAAQGRPLSEAQVLGDGLVAGLSPDGHAATAEVPWTPSAAGYYTVWAEIDPEDVVPESPAAAEANNIISRTLIVRPARGDETPPVVDGLTVDGGQDPVTSRGVTAEITAHDEGGSGLAQVYYVESHWVAAARAWVPVQWSAWQPYADQPHALLLAPEAGLRYLQAWVADGAGNISRRPATRPVSYVPAECDSLEQGEVRTFRLDTDAGRCLVAELWSDVGDADLYVWPPDYVPRGDYRFSRNPAGELDRIAVSPTLDGVYQIEVEAYTATSYRLSLAVEDTCPLAAQGTAPLAQGAKAGGPRNTPAVPLTGPNSAPPDEMAVPEPPPIQRSLHVPLLLTGWHDANCPSSAWRALVPVLVRP